MQTQDTLIVPYIFTLLLVVAAVSFISITLLLYHKKVTENTKLVETLRHQFAQELLKAQLEIEQQTMEQLSRELHDDIGSTFSLVKLTLDNIDITDHDLAGEKIEGAIGILSDGIEKIRHISRWVSLNVLKSGGLEHAMMTIIKQLEATNVYTIHVNRSGVYNFFSEQKEIILFRIFQEALNNIVRHAEATAIDIGLTFDEQVVILTIADNGKGFDEPSFNRQGGLSNMKIRASLIDGKLDIFSAPGRGTVLTIRAPITENSEHNGYHGNNVINENK